MTLDVFLCPDGSSLWIQCPDKEQLIASVDLPLEMPSRNMMSSLFQRNEIQPWKRDVSTLIDQRQRRHRKLMLACSVLTLDEEVGGAAKLSCGLTEPVGEQREEQMCVCVGVKQQHRAGLQHLL